MAAQVPQQISAPTGSLAQERASLNAAIDKAKRAGVGEDLLALKCQQMRQHLEGVISASGAPQPGGMAKEARPNAFDSLLSGAAASAAATSKAARDQSAALGMFDDPHGWRG